MKKLLTIIIIAGITTILACGPSVKEKSEKVKQDSLKTDSIAKANDNTPQNKILGTWIQDAGCKYSQAATKLIIKSKAEGRYLITIYEPASTGYPPEEQVNGILKTAMGVSIVDIPYKSYHREITFHPESSSMEFEGCDYSKQ